MQTARARLKPVSEMPEWAQCCEERIRLLHSQAGKETLLRTYQFIPRPDGVTDGRGDTKCGFCQHPMPAGRDAITLGEGRVAYELLEIDEGI